MARLSELALKRVIRLRANLIIAHTPAAGLGSKPFGLAGCGDLRAGADDMISLPDRGPAFGMWRLEEVQKSP